MSNKKQKIAQAFSSLGGNHLLDRYWGQNRLTVLAYHRIIEHETPQFADYRPVVSATPAMFAQQLDYIQAQFNVISIDDLHAAFYKDKPLPPRPLLITFDDGYLDNYEHAYPLLRARGLPAVIFLATSRMTHPRPLWWDAVARAFFYTTATDAHLPLLGDCSLTAADKNATLNKLLSALKQLHEEEKLAVVDEVQRTLGFNDTDSAPLFVNWTQVREMVNNGVACHAHTVSHPILTRISLEQAHQELALSRQHIIDETAQNVTAFAYPNGTAADYSPQIIAALQSVGYSLAFTLTPGPMAWQNARKHPLQIRRVYLGYQDSFEIFTVKVMGLPAFGEALAYPQAEENLRR